MRGILDFLMAGCLGAIIAYGLLWAALRDFLEMSLFARGLRSEMVLQLGLAKANFHTTGTHIIYAAAALAIARAAVVFTDLRKARVHG